MRRAEEEETTSADDVDCQLLIQPDPHVPARMGSTPLAESLGGPTLDCGGPQKGEETCRVRGSRQAERRSQSDETWAEMNYTRICDGLDTQHTVTSHERPACFTYERSYHAIDAWTLTRAQDEFGTLAQAERE